ncbi:MAG: zinc-dependent metalloprotease, partial [Bdellovibrionaceae bacterium]|nr:zinc-dependent metalloprotease [Pseudobdellovibrionaceae bacterium]
KNAEEYHAERLREILKSDKRISQQEKYAIQSELAHLQARRRLEARIGGRVGCVQFANSSSQANDTHIKDALYYGIISTLSHEIGHSLGLTHNFEGSFDSNHYNFADEGSEPVRNYSSIMDYMEDSKQLYNGPGPYDVFALRAGYTGILRTNDGKEISVEKLKNAAGDDWLKITSGMTYKALGDFYSYCNDRQIDWDLSCEPYDSGSSYTEKILNLMADYERNYLLLYHRHDRLNYSYRSVLRAQSWNAWNLIKARAFLEELFAIAVASGGRDPRIEDLQTAAIISYFFLNGIVTNPDAEEEFYSPSRFQAVPVTKKSIKMNEKGEPVLDAKGQPIFETKTEIEVVQKRQLQEQFESTGQIDTAGYDADKVTALEVLLAKTATRAKLASLGIELNYLDLESLLMDSEDIEKSVILNTTAAILRGRLIPVLAIPGAFVPLNDGRFSSEANLFMKQMAAITVGFFADSPSTRLKQNASHLFRVSTAKGSSVEGRASLAAIDSGEYSSGQVRYYAVDGAIMANRLIELAQKDMQISRVVELGGTHLLNLVHSQLKDAETEKLLSLLAREKVIATPLSASGIKNRLSSVLNKQRLDALLSFVRLVLSSSNQPDLQKSPLFQVRLAAARKALNEISKEAAQDILVEIYLSALTKSETPIKLVDNEQENALLLQFLKRGLSLPDREQSFSEAYRSVRLLNMITRIIAPEYSQ